MARRHGTWRQRWPGTLPGGRPSRSWPIGEQPVETARRRAVVTELAQRTVSGMDIDDGIACQEDLHELSTRELYDAALQHTGLLGELVGRLASCEELPGLDEDWTVYAYPGIDAGSVHLRASCEGAAPGAPDRALHLRDIAGQLCPRCSGRLRAGDFWPALGLRLDVLGVLEDLRRLRGEAPSLDGLVVVYERCGELEDLLEQVGSDHELAACCEVLLDEARELLFTWRRAVLDRDLEVVLRAAAAGMLEDEVACERARDELGRPLAETFGAHTTDLVLQAVRTRFVFRLERRSGLAAAAEAAALEGDRLVVVEMARALAAGRAVRTASAADRRRVVRAFVASFVEQYVLARVRPAHLVLASVPQVLSAIEQRDQGALEPLCALFAFASLGQSEMLLVAPAVVAERFAFADGRRLSSADIRCSGPIGDESAPTAQLAAELAIEGMGVAAALETARALDADTGAPPAVAS